MDSDYHKPHMAVRHRPHIFGRILHVLALLLLALTFFCFILVAVSGTWIQKEDKWRLGLANMSMVEFDGIIPKNGTTEEFQVKLRWFMASFGWEYLSSSKKEIQAGIVAQGFAQQLKFPDQLRDVAKRLDVSSSDYNCLHPDRGTCTNNFFAKFKDTKDLSYSTTFQWIMILLGLVFLLLVLIKDLLISFKKTWMKCHCFCLSSLCPNPKGTHEEILMLPPSFWDGLRIYWYLSGAVYMAVVSLVLTIRAKYVVDDLKDKKVPNVKTSELFLGMIWFATALMFVALICLCISKLCNKGRERTMALPSNNTHSPDMGHHHHPGPFGGPAPITVPHQEPYPAYMPPEPTLPSQHVPHPANTGGFNEGVTPPTYAGKPTENPYAKP